jgi:pSer/pThr/pTyr-binding forkhead associated (FHA) protein
MQQGNDSFRLIVRRGPQPNQTYDLNKDIITVGRDITNDIVINDPEVSRHHMRFTRGAGGFTLEDLGSTNGTFINGQRLTGAKPLNNGDMIGLGETVTLGYEMVGQARSAPGVSDQPAAPASPYARQPVQPPSPAPESQQPAPPPYSYTPQPTYSEAPPQVPTGYGGDYDPYAAREEEPRSNTMRWILIGCVGLALFCCCASVVGLFIIDQACLWDQIPILSNLLNALNFYSAC